METMDDRNAAYIAKKLEEALEALRGVTMFEGTSMAAYSRTLDARMAIAGAQGALEALQRNMRRRAA